MKQVTITTGKATIVVVDLPENFTEVHLSDKTRYADGKGNRLTLHVQHRKILEGEDLHTWLSEQHSRHIFDGDGEYKLLGHPSQLTEEDWKGIVDFQTTFQNLNRIDYMFEDYENSYHPFEAITFETAKESGMSLLKANGVILENPLGKEPFYYTDKFTGEKKVRLDWQKAQEKLWLNPHIFIKI